MENFSYTKFYAKKKFFKLFGNEIQIFTEDQSRLLFYVKQKAFKLKEDITVYTDKTMQQHVLKINARQIIDFSAAYDVTDSNGVKLGALRRRGFKSILKDEWQILDTTDQVIGKISEDSTFKAILRRFLTNLIPQTYFITIGDKVVGKLSQTFNPFIAQFRIDFSMDTANLLKREMGIASVILLQVIEGRQR